MKKIKLLAVTLLIFCSLPCFAIDLSRERDVRDYIQTISRDYGFDQAQLTSWFNQLDFEKRTMHKVQTTPTPVSVPFYIYRNKIITPARVQAGVVFWRQHAKALVQAEKYYGVPAEIIIGILGIETTYGTNTGHSSAFSGLATLAFKHPTRRAYFTSELTNFLLLSREHGWNPLAVRSSFDGGLGLPQFMPSSYRQYGVDANHDRDTKVDLWQSGDAIASIGNYLQAKGWQKGQPIVLPAKVLNQNYHQLNNPDGQPIFTLATLQQYGLAPFIKLPATTQAGALYLQNHNGREAWLTFHNFAVVKTYNNNTNYVMTAYELGKAVAAAKNKLI